MDEVARGVVMVVVVVGRAQESGGYVVVEAVVGVVMVQAWVHVVGRATGSAMGVNDVATADRVHIGQGFGHSLVRSSVAASQ